MSDIVDALAAGAGSPTGHHAVVIRSTVPPGTVDEVVTPLVAGRLGSSPVEVGTGMCPEFLREGSAIADFYDSPLTAVGTADERVGATVQRLLTFLPEPVKVVGTRDAEGLKYACNAYHATKVSFANELGRLFRLLGVDSREVMKLFCEDTKLNISTTYLSPGFAFGGSCLPKDLRSLLYLARMNSVDLPLLSGTLASNTLSVGDVVNRVLATDARSVALLGLSFKMDSDDLRESPYVDLAETLIGKGFDVRIYDPLVDTSKLVGANLNYVMSKLPARPAGHAADRGRRAARRRPRPRLERRPVGRRRPSRPTRRSPSSTSPGAWAPRSRRSPATRGWRGRATAPGPHHRPEPAGPLRPAGLAGVPVAHGGRLPGLGGVPPRPRRPGRGGHRGRHPLQVPAAEDRHRQGRPSCGSTSTRSSPPRG